MKKVCHIIVDHVKIREDHGFAKEVKVRTLEVLFSNFGGQNC